MPTPFTHLAVAAELLAAGALPEAVPAALPAFLLGNIAPDVQVVSGQTREATHFFPVPLDGAPPAERVLLAQYPGLAPLGERPPAQAVFLAGYLAHLVFDQFWVRMIFEPVFGPAQTWGENFKERLYLHNVLRAHWDALDLARLGPTTAVELAAAEPAAWLPFVEDTHLGAWRDWVAGQLGEAGGSRTVEVFANRMGADPAIFAALLASPDELQDRLFRRLPPGALDEYRAEALAESLAVIQRYW
jgi:hypothetical protein